jgi:LmbE family N-acetylglucosaminyl deacetylase
METRAPLPERIRRPESGTVLVFAPHPDDEVIGCGGTLALHALQGDPIHVVVAFDGAASDRGTLGDSGDERSRELAALRRAEALDAGAVLCGGSGRIEYLFLDHPEGHEPDERELARGVRQLADIVRDVVPRSVYAPWIGEHHLDHHVLSRAVRLAMIQAGGDFLDEDMAAWGYEVWTPLVPTRVVDISPVVDVKRAALREHASQLVLRDLVHAALGLNAQRSLYLAPGARAGEAFAPLFPVSGGERLVRCAGRAMGWEAP